MGKVTAAVSIGQTAWDTLFDSTTKDSDDLTEGSTNKYDTGAPPTDLADLDSTAATKLSGIDEGATVDQTAAEIQTAIKAMAWADRDIVVSEPAIGEYKVKGIHRNAASELEYDYEETAES